MTVIAGSEDLLLRHPFEPRMYKKSPCPPGHEKRSWPLRDLKVHDRVMNPGGHELFFCDPFMTLGHEIVRFRDPFSWPSSWPGHERVTKTGHERVTKNLCGFSWISVGFPGFPRISADFRGFSADFRGFSSDFCKKSADFCNFKKSQNRSRKNVKIHAKADRSWPGHDRVMTLGHELWFRDPFMTSGHETLIFHDLFRDRVMTPRVTNPFFHDHTAMKISTGREGRWWELWGYLGIDVWS